MLAKESTAGRAARSRRPTRTSSRPPCSSRSLKSSPTDCRGRRSSRRARLRSRTSAPATGVGEVTAHRRLATTRTGRPLSEPFRRSRRLAVPRRRSPTSCCRSASQLPGFDLPAAETGTRRRRPAAALRGGRVETAAITNVRELPDQWFGYAGRRPRRADHRVGHRTSSSTSCSTSRSRAPFKDRRGRAAGVGPPRRPAGRLASASNAAKLAQSELFQRRSCPFAVIEPDAAGPRRERWR